LTSDLEIKHTNDVSKVAVGSKSEIERFNKIMNSKINYDVFHIALLASIEWTYGHSTGFKGAELCKT
jgi:hypothetical protein